MTTQNNFNWIGQNSLINLQTEYFNITNPIKLTCIMGICCITNPSNNSTTVYALDSSGYILIITPTTNNQSFDYNYINTELGNNIMQVKPPCNFIQCSLNSQNGINLAFTFCETNNDKTITCYVVENFSTSKNSYKQINVPGMGFIEISMSPDGNYVLFVSVDYTSCLLYQITTNQFSNLQINSTNSIYTGGISNNAAHIFVLGNNNNNNIVYSCDYATADFWYCYSTGNISQNMYVDSTGEYIICVLFNQQLTFNYNNMYGGGKSSENYNVSVNGEYIQQNGCICLNQTNNSEGNVLICTFLSSSGINAISTITGPQSFIPENALNNIENLIISSLQTNNCTTSNTTTVINPIVVAIGTTTLPSEENMITPFYFFYGYASY